MPSRIRKSADKIDDLHALFQELGRRFGRRAMRKSEKDNVGVFRDRGDVQFFTDKARASFQELVQLVDGLPGKAFRGEMGERHLRMADEVAQELSSSIAGGSDNRYAYHVVFKAFVGARGARPVGANGFPFMSFIVCHGRASAGRPYNILE